MKYQAELYAKAFVETIAKAPNEKQGVFLRKFIEIIRKNGDFLRIEKIFQAVRNAFVKNQGGRIVTLELARNIPEDNKNFKRFFSDKNHVEIVIRPELVAGMRILIDGEKELDCTLQRKLNRLFK